MKHMPVIYVYDFGLVNYVFILYSLHRRERVKRRRAQKEAAAGTTSDAADNGNKQPDLSKLSRDLPPGWQVFHVHLPLIDFS